MGQPALAGRWPPRRYYQGWSLLTILQDRGRQAQVTVNSQLSRLSWQKRLALQGGCATFLCQPLDVLKTRLMNAKGEYRVSGLPALLLAGEPVSLGRGTDEAVSLPAAIRPAAAWAPSVFLSQVL